MVWEFWGWELFCGSGCGFVFCFVCGLFFVGVLCVVDGVLFLFGFGFVFEWSYDYDYVVVVDGWVGFDCFEFGDVFCEFV